MKNFTKFNPKGKKRLTYGEVLKPAMEITDPEDAKQYFNTYVEFVLCELKNDKTKYRQSEAIDIDAMLRKEAEDICKSNLGYFAGYYDNETRKRVEELFLCEHPVFGSYKENSVPTPEEAFNAGMNYTKGK